MRRSGGDEDGEEFLERGQLAGGCFGARGAVAVGDEDAGDVGAAGTLEVGIVVADDPGVGRGHICLSGDDLDHFGVGFEVGNAAAAEDAGEEAGDAEVAEDGVGGLNGFVGGDGEGVA